MLFLAKSPFCQVFTGNKIEEKYHGSFSQKEGPWSFGSREGSHEARTRSGGAPQLFGRATNARSALDRRLVSPLREVPYIP